mmetsp:Transcript_40972/g.101849  ORF Transcript_40972/g.101849 Transcript_40972/m.101849 type:complete len:217 (+) Transcript_40972:451-1101(+)
MRNAYERDVKQLKASTSGVTRDTQATLLFALPQHLSTNSLSVLRLFAVCEERQALQRRPFSSSGKGHFFPKPLKSILSAILGAAGALMAPGAGCAVTAALSRRAVSIRLRVPGENEPTALRNSFGERFASAVKEACANADSSFCVAEGAPSAASHMHPTRSGSTIERHVTSASAGASVQTSRSTFTAAGLSAAPSATEESSSCATSGTSRRKWLRS